MIGRDGFYQFDNEHPIGDREFVVGDRSNNKFYKQTKVELDPYIGNLLKLAHIPDQNDHVT
jgi:hypothetical protein